MKKHIPNTITCCNLISGCIAVTQAYIGATEMALLWIVIGAVFDFFDGMSARLLHVSSPIGKELDSLADDITFGVAPAMVIFYALTVMEYPDFLEPCRSWLPYTAFLLAAFSALRLAKFNLDERQTMGFIGLPTPANALFWASLMAGYPQIINSTSYMVIIVIALMLLSCWLLISEVPMFALKFKHWGLSEPGNLVKYGFIVFCAAILLFQQIAGIAVIIVAYIILSIILDITHRQAPQPQQS